jgi:NAD(P)-dependent dehydrogenase (short-subunit alcohol dehydrogenase family)
MKLEGKVAVVTGAARGMGRSFASGFLREGAKVVAIDLSWEPRGVSNDRDGTWMAEMQARDDVLCLSADISNEEQVRAAFEAVMDRWGRVDVLCNNAGMRQRILFPPGLPVTVMQTTNDDFRRMYEVTVFGTLLMTRAFARPMIVQKRGSIFSVVTSGLLMIPEEDGFRYLRPNSREQPYTSAKAALANIMCYMGDELREDNVAVNAFVPGHTRTSGFEEQAEGRRQMGRDTGPVPYHPDHVQPLAIFLAQQDAASGNTAKIWDTPQWLASHGFGPLDRWLCPGGDIWAPDAPGSWAAAGFAEAA